MIRALALGSALLAAASAGAATRRSQPIATPIGKPIDCVSTSSIDSTQVRDDRTIDFYMRGGQVLRNTLPSACPELGFEEGFSYHLSTSRLCSVDIITVLRRAGGLRRGASCGLGKFQPVKLTPR